VTKTANVRITRTTEDGVEWHRMTIDIGAVHLEPPLAFRTLEGLCAILADVLREELVPSTSTTEPALVPVEVP
jgi:hypothetical protein